MRNCKNFLFNQNSNSGHYSPNNEFPALSFRNQDSESYYPRAYLHVAYTRLGKFSLKDGWS